MGEAAFNLVHRKKLTPDDAGLKARRPPDEAKVEFLASTDNWFRPVQFANAPDGALYVLDMYREIVEHPWSLPESIKKFLDLNSGSDRGRIPDRSGRFQTAKARPIGPGDYRGVGGSAGAPECLAP